jgi:hypothetical protein
MVDSKPWIENVIREYLSIFVVNKINGEFVFL